MRRPLAIGLALAFILLVLAACPTGVLSAQEVYSRHCLAGCPDDYTGANAALGTDRGHQAPLASFAGTDHWRDTNVLSNITPQASALSQGPWARLETRVRDLRGRRRWRRSTS